MENKILRLKEKVYYQLMTELCPECSWNLFLSREMKNGVIVICEKCYREFKDVRMLGKVRVAKMANDRSVIEEFVNEALNGRLQLSLRIRKDRSGQAKIWLEQEEGRWKKQS